VHRMSRRLVLTGSLLPVFGITACAPYFRLGSSVLAAEPSAPTPQPASTPIPVSSAASVQTLYAINVDASQHLRPISPLIYGLAGGSAALQKQVRPALMRWGGNPSSRYNWRLGNAWNAARDWEFRNGNYGSAAPDDRVPSGVADKTISANQAAGAATLLTIPALGWVAKDDNNDSRSLDVPKGGGPALAGSAAGAIAGYDPSVNRTRTSVPSASRSSDTAVAGTVFQNEWVQHLVQRYGAAARGGVQYYAIDNEPDLWDGTHTDVHPAQMSYASMLSTFVDYATAIKDVDPTAQVTGPVLSGWTGLYYSALDRGTDNFGSSADRKAHGGTPFLPWWLAQVRQHDEQAGKRTLDVVDVHWYPQGGEYTAGGTDPKMNALRLRSTRSLWDPTYVDESWIGKTWDEHTVQGVVRLIPRLREWVAANYPGTKIGITEWNWGADDTPNGALAIAEVLGIFGREGVDLAAYWTAPKDGSPGAVAFQAYRNYDGKGGQFGSIALASATTDDDRLSCYGSLDNASGIVTAVVLNKDASASAPVSVQVSNFSGTGVTGYQYAGAVNALQLLPTLTLDGGRLALLLPPGSITVLRFSPQ
jgi:hypothetical protein